jgi:hypothetical protein
MQMRQASRGNGVVAAVIAVRGPSCPVRVVTILVSISPVERRCSKPKRSGTRKLSPISPIWMRRKPPSWVENGGFRTPADPHPSSRVHRTYRHIFARAVFVTGLIEPQTPMRFLPQLEVSFDPPK